ncbi:MAG: nicotinamide mononucleotide transporter [Kiritimatiellae bacterium]|nr:nicotinamide mononucleotide transporter [Kiritimatiellia bacterium]
MRLSKVDCAWCVGGTLSVVLTTLFSHEGAVPFLSALTGVWYVLLAGQGRRIAFLPGAINIVLYAYLSWMNAYYGEFLLQTLYYFPMNIAGWFLWKRHLKADTGCIVKRRLPILWYGLLLIGLVGAVIAFGVFLQWMGGRRVWLDSVTTVVSIVAQALAVGRYAEQWILWIVVNAVSVILWFGAEESALVTSIMWGFYLCYALAMAIRWHRETA